MATGTSRRWAWTRHWGQCGRGGSIATFEARKEAEKEAKTPFGGAGAGAGGEAQGDEC